MNPNHNSATIEENAAQNSAKDVWPHNVYHSRGCHWTFSLGICHESRAIYRLTDYDSAEVSLNLKSIYLPFGTCR